MMFAALSKSRIGGRLLAPDMFFPSMRSNAFPHMRSLVVKKRAMAEDNGSPADPGRPPALSHEATVAFLTKHYPFKHVFPDSLKPLPSYDDRNVYFAGTPEGDDGGSGREQFVLKMHNSGVCTPRMLEGLNAVMLFLRERGFPCCYPIATRDGRHLIQSELPAPKTDAESRGGPEYSVKVLRFIPGCVMDKLEKRFLTPELFYSVGNLIGRMDLALQDFTHTSMNERKLKEWDLMHFTHVKQYIPHLRDEQKKRVASSVVALYEKHVTPAIPLMKKGVIHNDANGLNILFSDKCEISGMIDFGDCIRTCYLFELAIMLAYGMVEKDDPVQCVAPMFRGYRDVFPLSADELSCLYYAVLARLCQSAVNGEYHFTLEPWNTYLLTTPAEAWKLMNLLLTLTRERVEEIWGVWTK